MRVSKPLQFRRKNILIEMLDIIDLPGQATVKYF